ncbi:MAG: glycogen/starch synthase, partial [Oscillospiraceae bacterium]|nr:glycogen/starch synthase [Oscillospiraceae bacterium]
FSRAVLEMLDYIDFKPEIIHANDWQCALIPVFYNLYYRKREGYENIKTVYTIHNIQYQGKYGFEILEDVFGISPDSYSIVEQDGCINLMKGGIESADCVTTVSPTYAKELLYPYYSHGLDGILRTRQRNLHGILNGIDTDTNNPETDKQIWANYTAEDPAAKAVNKRKLQERMNLPLVADVPLIAMVTRLASHKGLDLVKSAIRELLKGEIQFVLLGSGDWAYESFFKDIQADFPDKMSYYSGFVPELAHKIYAGADIFLMPSQSEPCGLAQMIACRYGTVPIVRETGGLKDSISDCGDGQGIGFTFKTYSSDDMMDAIHRALGGYADKEMWNVLIGRCMNADFSWGRSANEYIRLYRSLLK